MVQSDTGAAVSTVLSVSLGASSYLHLFDRLNHYAPLIGVVLSFLFGLFGGYLAYKSFKKEKKADSNEKRIVKVEETVEKIESGIEFIKKHINKG